MASLSDANNTNPLSQESLAIELGNLRGHFLSTSVFGVGMPAGEPLVDRRSPLQLDNAFVQQTKDQIRTVVENIAALANAPIEPNSFVQAVLPKIANAMGASAAALWQQLPDSTWRMMGDFNLPTVLLATTTEKKGEIQNTTAATSFEQLDFLEFQLNGATQADLRSENAVSPINSSDRNASPNTSESAEEKELWRPPSALHTSVLDAVARERQPILVPPGDTLLDRDRPSNPTSELLIYAPLPIPKELGVFWLQVVQSPSGGPSSQRGYLRFVAQMADLMSDYFRSHRLRVFERDRECLTLAERTMNELASGLTPKLGLAKLMKSIRENARSEHAFLLRRDSSFGRWRVMGAAGLVDIDRKADGIGQIERASSSLHAIHRNGGSLCASELDGGVDERDPDLTQLFNTFAISELHWIKPLRVDPALPSRRNQKLDVAVLLTWSGIDKPPSRCFEQSALISRLGLTALQVPWWKSALIASQQNKPAALALANPATWPSALKWSVGIAILGLILAFPVPIRLNATAVLVPLVQQHFHAPVDATVDKVYVAFGQSVKVGEPLIQLKSPSLQEEHDRSVAGQRRNRQRLEELEDSLLRDLKLSVSESEKLEAERNTIKSTQLAESNRIVRLQSQLDSLVIRASIDGIVATWNVQENLRDRPLREGQLLMTLHESESAWVFEAALPERDAQEFHVAMEKKDNLTFATLTNFPQTPVPVHLLRSSKPRIENSQQQGSMADPSSAMLRIRFEVEDEAMPAKAAVAGATARISIPIGRGPLLWALGRDFATKVWSRVQLWI